MNEFDRQQRLAAECRLNYPPGTRRLLLKMGDDPRPIEDNTRGTVDVVDDMGTIHCTFDNGRRLGMVPGEDCFRKLSQEEIAEEQLTMAEDDNIPTMRTSM